jgi:hypothetical protein
MSKTVNEMMVARSNGINEALRSKGAEFRVVYISSFKNNTVCDGYNLVTEGKSVSPVIYYSEEWWSNDDEEIAEYLIHQSKNVPDKEVDVKEIMQPAFILENVLPRLFGENNREKMLLHDRAFVSVLDFLVGFYVPVQSISSDDSLASIPVTKSLLNEVGLKVEEILKKAIENVSRQSKVMDMLSLLGDMAGVPEELVREEQSPHMIVVTNEQFVNGAACILSTDVQKKVEQILGDEFNVLPSSIHECICVPVMDKDTLLSMVKSVNATYVRKSDRLTDSVYLYRKGKFEKVA